MIYLAGPLFTAEERRWNRVVADYLEQFGEKIFLPQRDCDFKNGTKGIFESCVRGLWHSKSIVANLNGADADSGTCWELGYVFGAKQAVAGINGGGNYPGVINYPGVLWYRTDFRGSADDESGVNAMLAHSGNRIYATMDTTPKELAGAICEVLAKIRQST